MAKKRIVGNPMTTPYNPNAYSITVDDKLSSDSTNPVQNKVVTEALDDKLDISRANILMENNQDPNTFEVWGINIIGSANSADKATTADWATRAYQDDVGNYITDTYLRRDSVDDCLDVKSENPVQNKVVTEVLESKVDKVEGYDLVGVTEFGHMASGKTWKILDTCGYNITIPAYTSDLENDSTFVTEEDVKLGIQDISLVVYADKAASIEATRRDGTKVEGITTALATSDMVHTEVGKLNAKIGDIETALDNIIAKYGLGGEAE